MSGELYQLDSVNSRETLKEKNDLAHTQIGATNYL
jgi:hypothetical protein